MTSLPSDALVVVADGQGARLFRNRGERGAVSLHQVDLLELMNMNDDGPAGSMPGESSSRQIDEARFAKQLAKGLNDSALKQQYAHLVWWPIRSRWDACVRCCTRRPRSDWSPRSART